MAGQLGGFLIQIGADISEFEKKIKAVQRGLDKVVGRDFARFAGQVRTAMMGAAGALGLVGVAAVRSAAQFEQQRIAFTSLLKSGDKATAMLKEIQKFASSTPFQFDGLVVASKKMLAFGFEAEKVLPTLRTVGDAAAGLGLGAEGIDRITRALGQMKQKGRVSAQEINQLAEAGIGAWEYIAKAAGKSVAEVQKASEQGLISGKAGVAAILAGMDTQFAGLMEKQAGTINGILSNITDNVGEAMRGIGQGLIDNLPIKETLAGIRDEIGKFSAMITDSGFMNALQLAFIKYLGYDTYTAVRATANSIQWLTEKLLSLGKTISDVVGPSNAMNFALSLLAVTIGSTLVYSLGAFGLALTRLVVAHPYLLALAAAATLVVTAFQNWNGIALTLSNILADVQGWFGALKDILLATAEMIANGVMVVISKVVQKVFEIISGSASVVADMAKSLLPGWASYAADIITILNPVYDKISSMAKAASDDFANRFEKSLMGVGEAMDKNIKITNEQKKANREYYEQLGLAQKQAKEFLELQLQYGPQIEKSFDSAKTAIISAYESIKSSGSNAWMAGITLVEQFIDKLQGVTSYMIPIIGAANALREAFGFTGIELSLGSTEDGNGKKKGGGGGGGGKGKSAADQAREAADLYRSTFREFRDLQKELVAPQTGAAGLFQQLDEEITGVRDHWVDALDEIAAKWDETSKMGRDSIIKAMQEAGIQYQVSENGKLDLTRQRLLMETQLEQEKERRKLEIINSGQALEAELDRLANERDLAGYTQLLNSKNAAFLASLEGERQAMDSYRSLMMEANRSSLSYMAEASQMLTQGLTDAIVGIVTGTKKAGEAFRELGKQIVTMVVRWMVQRAVSAAMAKTLETGMAATSSAAAATINAAWAPAAANVAIATMGGAIGPAMAGLTAATASYRAMSTIGLAKGGIVTGPTMAMIGEGRDDEAVIPLNDRILSKIGGGGRGNVQVIVNNQTGVKASARAETSFDAQGTIVTIFLDALGRNVGNLRDQVAAVRG